jgi:hypothetical protein
MNESFTIFSESNIVLTDQQKLTFDRLTGDLSDVVKRNTEMTDDQILGTKEYIALTKFAESVFAVNRKVMSQFVWRTIAIGCIQTFRISREY